MEVDLYGDILVGVGDIIELSKELQVTSFKHISRSRNEVAHSIARGPEFLSYSNLPTGILHLIVNDVTEQGL